MQIADLMRDSGVTFGTSGARGLVERMTDRICYAYTSGFLGYLRDGDAGLAPGQAVGIAGDLRPSTPRIMRACARAIHDAGCRPVNAGFIPTPALTAYGIAHAMPTLMVTGSHIPDDRNGIKFNLPQGEILKADEAGIRRQVVALPEDLFDASGALRTGEDDMLPPADVAAYHQYVARFIDFFPPDCLCGMRIGVYQHSSVAREALIEVISALGAEAIPLARSETFIPVDTEALRPEDVTLARDWAATGRFDALVSTDGDGDRPLVADEHGLWLRGDIAGVLAARALGASAVVTPVSSNTVVEACGAFQRVLRTRIGSPYVIAGMQQLTADGIAPVVGYEANGGLLLGSDLSEQGRVLCALPTRDALILILTILRAARVRGLPLSALATDLPQRVTASDRLKNVSSSLSQVRLAALHTGNWERDRVSITALFGTQLGEPVEIDHTDGVRIHFKNGEIVHLRPSGNAPELRIYTEAATSERAEALNRFCVEVLGAAWFGQEASYQTPVE